MFIVADLVSLRVNTCRYFGHILFTLFCQENVEISIRHKHAGYAAKENSVYNRGTLIKFDISHLGVRLYIFHLNSWRFSKISMISVLGKI